MENKLFSYKLIQGLMRITSLSEEQFSDLMMWDIQHGIVFFDISDIYGGVGQCEEMLGRFLEKNPSLRKKIIIQSKCGLTRILGRDEISCYDLSYQHIISACQASLKRMHTEYLDYYLLHRPDILMDNKEVDQAFSELKKKGLVKHFGVSNFAPQAIEYLKDGTKIPLEINQMQLGLGHLNLVREVMNTDVFTDEGMPTGLDLFFYMKRNKMALQCWSPYLIDESATKRTSLFSDPNYEELRKELQALADKYHSTPSGIATAFLIGLGENVQVVTGSVTISHIEEELDGTKVKLSKEDFYALYRSTGNLLP